jgi:hypothetical protein
MSLRYRAPLRYGEGRTWFSVKGLTGGWPAAELVLDEQGLHLHSARRWSLFAPRVPEVNAPFTDIAVAEVVQGIAPPLGALRVRFNSTRFWFVFTIGRTGARELGAYLADHGVPVSERARGGW